MADKTATGPLPADIRRARELLQARKLFPDISPLLLADAAFETGMSLEKTLQMAAALLATEGERNVMAIEQGLEEEAA